MSKTVELARHLSTLNINNMYKTDFYWTWDKTDDEIDAIFNVVDALRDLRERNKSTRVFDSGLGISIFCATIGLSVAAALNCAADRTVSSTSSQERAMCFPVRICVI